MDFKEYQKKAVAFAIYPEAYKVIYPTLGLCGEAGEVAEKVKKQVRDGNFNRHEVAKELGDVLWYLANLANDIGYSLSEVAAMNVDKLQSRKDRGVISGSGDNR
jgi:NTP pyrophosphatase (non-canonical NTP hydrolase)